MLKPSTYKADLTTHSSHLVTGSQALQLPSSELTPDNKGTYEWTQTAHILFSVGGLKNNAAKMGDTRTCFDSQIWASQ
jgi:hypothetical protein